MKGGNRVKVLSFVVTSLLVLTGCSSEQNVAAPESETEEVAPVREANDVSVQGIDQLSDRDAYIANYSRWFPKLDDKSGIANVMLRVSPGDDGGFWPYEWLTSGPFYASQSKLNHELPLEDPWLGAPSNKYTNDLIVYDAVIWQDAGVVTLYQFENDYKPITEMDESLTEEEMFSYREQYAVMSFPYMPRLSCVESTCEPVDFPDGVQWGGSTHPKATSVFLRDAFSSIADELVTRHTEANHFLKYNGHGAPGGHLFGYLMHEVEAYEFLESWTSSLGRKLGFIDMSGPCNKGSMADLMVFAPFSSYVLGTDLVNGGYDYDLAVEDRYDEIDWDGLNIDLQIFRIFAETSEPEEVALAALEVKRQRYEASRQYIQDNQIFQSSYVYDSEAFLEFEADFTAQFPELSGPQIEDAKYDVRSFLGQSSENEELLKKFEEIFVFSVDTRDFLEFNFEANGIILNLDLQEIRGLLTAVS